MLTLKMACDFVSTMMKMVSLEDLKGDDDPHRLFHHPMLIPSILGLKFHLSLNVLSLS